LVEEEGREELAPELARALVGRGVALEQMERWSEALECYNEAIGWWEQWVQVGRVHVMPDLIKGLGVRFALRRRLGEWEPAAEDVVRVLTYAAPFLQEESPPEPLVRELAGFLARLRDLSDEEREPLYTALGQWAEVVRRFAEG